MSTEAKLKAARMALAENFSEANYAKAFNLLRKFERRKEKSGCWSQDAQKGKPKPNKYYKLILDMLEARYRYNTQIYELLGASSQSEHDKIDTALHRLLIEGEICVERHGRAKLYAKSVTCRV